MGSYIYDDDDAGPAIRGVINLSNACDYRGTRAEGLINLEMFFLFLSSLLYRTCEPIIKKL